MDVGPGMLLRCVDDARSVWGFSPLSVGAIYTLDCVVAVPLEGDAYLLREVAPPEGFEGFAPSLFVPIRKPPLPAKILALQNTLPASPEPVPA
jgi:hypothetical protein